MRVERECPPPLSPILSDGIIRLTLFYDPSNAVSLDVIQISIRFDSNREMYIVHVFRIGIVSIPWKVTCSNSRTTGVLYSRYVSYNIRGIRRKAGQLTMRSMIGKRAIYICNLISNEIFKLLRSIPFHPSFQVSREIRAIPRLQIEYGTHAWLEVIDLSKNQLSIFSKRI